MLLQATRGPQLTFPIWLPSDPSSWPGGSHLQMKPQQLPHHTHLLTLESADRHKVRFCVTEQD